MLGEKTPHTTAELEQIAKCIGLAVAPYAFKLGHYYHNDRKYADNLPFTDIETEAKAIIALFASKPTAEMEEYAKTRGACYAGKIADYVEEEILKIAEMLTTKHEAELESAVEAERERIRKVATTRTRKLKIGQNEHARKTLNLTEKQIDDHNDYCEAWEDGYDAAKNDVMKALNLTTLESDSKLSALISCSCYAAGEELDRGDKQPCRCRGDGLLEVLGQAAVAAEPCKGPLDHPASGQDLEALGVV